jgi:hypothetical protein
VKLHNEYFGHKHDSPHNESSRTRETQ